MLEEEHPAGAGADSSHSLDSESLEKIPPETTNRRTPQGRPLNTRQIGKSP